MRKAKRYYVDENGNMIGYNRGYSNNKVEVPANTFRSKLKIVGVGWLNNGVCFSLMDESGKVYNMNDVMFGKYIKQNDVFIEGEFDFYQQGTAFSIGPKSMDLDRPLFYADL